MMHLILGGAGFIGTNLAKKLLGEGQCVYVIDDLSNGRRCTELELSRNYKFFECQLSNFNEQLPLKFLESKGNEKFKLWHLAANSDIAKGTYNPTIDFYRTLGTTITALEIVKVFNKNIEQFIFASSSAIYGDQGNKWLNESTDQFSPISNYGVAKLAAEGFIRTSPYLDQISTRIYRFPNVIGTPLTHGVIHDLYLKLQKRPHSIEVLGKGYQQKPFLHVQDLINEMVKLNSVGEIFEVFNIGPNDEGITIKNLAEVLRDEISTDTELTYQQSSSGWRGDIPKYYFDISKALEHGMNPNLKSLDAVQKVSTELKLIE